MVIGILAGIVQPYCNPVSSANSAAQILKHEEMAVNTWGRWSDDAVWRVCVCDQQDVRQTDRGYALYMTRIEVGISPYLEDVWKTSVHVDVLIDKQP